MLDEYQEVLADLPIANKVKTNHNVYKITKIINIEVNNKIDENILKKIQYRSKIRPNIQITINR